MGDLGTCYPARCSPAEILIATKDGALINNTNAYPQGVYGMQYESIIEAKYSDANDGIWNGLNFFLKILRWN